MASELAHLEGDIAQQAASDELPMHPLRPIQAIREAFPRETTVGFDVGCLAQHMAGVTPYFKVYEPRSTIVPSSFYGMGFVAAALPAARAGAPRPRRPCASSVTARSRW